MPYKFFYIPVPWSGDAEAELNAFLKRHAIQSIDRELVTLDGQAGWTFSIAYNEGGGDAQKRKSGPDYREVLNAADFDVFSQLRQLRKRFAEEQQVPRGPAQHPVPTLRAKSRGPVGE